jgi:magnesium transporter
MTPDYIAIRETWTVQQVLDYIRQHGGQSETLSMLYVTDAQGVLIDDIRIREFLLSAPTARVRDLMDRRFVQLTADQDQEEAIDVFRRNDRNALPVVSDQGILLGIVTIDDILSIREQEDTEDMQKLGGSEALDEPYLATPLLGMLKKRAGWLVILLIGEMFTATALKSFEDEIAKAVVLTIFIPLIISAGGNAGSQATSLIIRAILLGHWPHGGGFAGRHCAVGFIMRLHVAAAAQAPWGRPGHLVGAFCGHAGRRDGGRDLFRLRPAIPKRHAAVAVRPLFCLVLFSYAGS